MLDNPLPAGIVSRPYRAPTTSLWGSEPASGAPSSSSPSHPAGRCFGGQAAIAHRAPADAAMTFSGPQLLETQSKKHLSQAPEHARWEYLRSGVHARSNFEARAGSSSSAHWTQDPAGDGSKFHAGFFRRKVDWAPSREGEDAARGAAFAAHDGARRAHLAATASKTGFNPITGVEVAPQKDDFKPRGRVCVRPPSPPLALFAVAVRAFCV